LPDEPLVQLLWDGQRLVQQFHDPIRLSALQVYYSAVPFTPKGMILYHMFSEQLQDTVQGLSGAGWPLRNCLKILEEHSSEVLSVAFSPDGSKVVSGSADNTLHIWDVATGAQTSAPLECHSGRVSSVAFLT
jgi:WD40 repeat protein